MSTKISASIFWEFWILIISWTIAHENTKNLHLPALGIIWTWKCIRFSYGTNCINCQRLNKCPWKIWLFRFGNSELQKNLWTTQKLITSAFTCFGTRLKFKIHLFSPRNEWDTFNVLTDVDEKLCLSCFEYFGSQKFNGLHMYHTKIGKICVYLF